MLLKIEKLERTTKLNKNQEEMDGLWIEGMKLYDDKPPEKWEKFLMDWKDAQHIEELERMGVGATALIKMVRNKRFWDIEYVEPWRGKTPEANSPTSGYDNPPAQPDHGDLQPGISGTATVALAEALDIRAKEFHVKKSALSSAIAHVGNMLIAPERFKKLLKATISPELLVQLVKDYCKIFEQYLNGGTEDEEEKAQDDQPNKEPVELPEDSPPF